LKFCFARFSTFLKDKAKSLDLANFYSGLGKGIQVWEHGSIIFSFQLTGFYHG
jgi:hypothetical protein